MTDLDTEPQTWRDQLRAMPLAELRELVESGTSAMPDLAEQADTQSWLAAIMLSEAVAVLIERSP